MPYADINKRRECTRRWFAKAYKERPEHYAEINKRYRRRNAERVRLRRFKERYGLSAGEHAAMFWKQNGCCAVCERPEVKKRGGYLHVDHNHETGKVRGLLCSSCNRAAGFMRDSAETLKKLAAYLEENS